MEMYSSDEELARAWDGAMRHGDLSAAHAIAALIRRLPLPDPRYTPRHHQRIWNGDAIDGRVVLVRCYHGLGDTIQFARFLPMVAARASLVHVWIQPALIPLLSSLDTSIQWHALHDGVFTVPFDVDVEIMELPQLFGTTVSEIPFPAPTHFPFTKRSQRRSERPRIGLVWRAGSWAPHRSIPLPLVEQLIAGIPEVDWVRVQQGTVPVPILETVRCMQRLDLMISVDSMPAHLAGLLGVPVWTLLPADADWRWLEHRHDSPWYPTMHLFRQLTAGEWEPVLHEVQRQLGRKLRTRSA